MGQASEGEFPQQRKRIFWIALVLSLTLMSLLNLVGAPLITEPAPYGIVSFELAGNPSQAQAMLDSWDGRAQLAASFSLGLDYVFMVAYALAISLGCLWAAESLRRQRWPLAWMGAPLAWLQWLAAALDGLENLGLIKILLDAPASPWPEIARWCATIKFGLIFIGLVYAFLGAFVSLVGRVARRP
ncbi:MAG: hypothetical protein AB1894_28915 [Chloroflexota bacterium]